MGAVTFIEKVRGTSMSNACQKARTEADREHEHEQGYSGAINSTYGLEDMTKEYENSKTPLSKYIEMILENASKGDCFGICLEKPKVNTNKIKTHVEHVVVKGTTKWVLKYIVNLSWRTDHSYISSHNTKGAAVTAARAYTEKHGVNTEITMEKIMEKGNPLVAKVSYKKSSNEKDGLYVLFGLAPD